MSTLITLESVFKNDDKDEKPILKDINTDISKGELTTIIGPSGSGKSTFLLLLNRMIEPDSGTLKLDGVPFKDIDVLSLRRKIGMVFQTPIMLKGSVKDNIMVGPTLHQETLTDIEIEQFLNRVGLPKSFMDKEAQKLSGGEKQRVSLARTLANQSEVLLLDEATASLDANSSLEIEQLILSLHQESRKTIIWVTHNLEQAQRIGQKTLVIAAGEIIERGPTKEIFSHPKKDITKHLIEQLKKGQNE